MIDKTMKTNKSLRRGFTLVELLVVIVIIAALAGLTAPMVIRERKKADQAEAVNNARQIGIALLDFEKEYTTFPDDTTAIAVKGVTDTALVSGTTSNDRFRQLVRAGIAQSEAMFYAKTAYTQKPDGILTTDIQALAAGEVGYGILMDGVKGLNAAGDPSRPIVAAPLKLAMNGTFDSNFYDSKAVILRLDNSVTSLPIVSTTSNVKIKGKTMTETGTDSVWGITTVVPTWSYPDPKNQFVIKKDE
jgi:prepilin-type N-terminal cleavage/methylation domain-containing protein